jgi:serine/threonine protein kinase
MADYGLCKENMKYGSHTSTFCGTPEFMAPEILAERPYGRPVDWWAFGVLIYEMLLGKAPFSGDTEERIFNSIVKDTPSFPSSMQPEAVDIIQKVCLTNTAPHEGPIQTFGKLKTGCSRYQEAPLFCWN